MKRIKNAAGLIIMLLALIVIKSTPASAQQTAKLGDDEIASVAVVANQGDIGFATIAQKRSKNTEILKFAATMTSDHQAVITQAVALVTKLKVTPKDNEVSRKLKADAEKTRATLNSTPKSAFDKAYIDNEVGYHKAVISTVENLLVPQTQNAELKALLQQVLPTLKTHLAHAEMVQSHISK